MRAAKKPTWESCGGATLKIFDLLEIQANAVFADEIMGEVHMPSIKIPLKTKSGDIKGTLKAYIFVEENISTTGCLATFPNPVGRPPKPFSIRNFRHEVQRLVRWIGWITGFFWACRQSPKLGAYPHKRRGNYARSSHPYGTSVLHEIHGYISRLHAHSYNKPTQAKIRWLVYGCIP